MELHRAELTRVILDAFYHVHRALGHGFLESVYERAMEIELRKRGLSVARQVSTQVYYDGMPVGHFVADMIVEGCILLELKAAARISGAHEAQLLNYLRSSDLEIGLVLNFGIKPEVSRFVGPAARQRRQ